MSANRTWIDRTLKALSSLQTGIFLLILVGLASIAGTLILQRPITDPDTLARTYRPETLAWFDRLGLTDVFHAWWFVALLALLSVNIVLASMERLPVAWRFIRKPYRSPDPHFLAGLPLHREISIRSEASGLEAAERALRRMGFRPQHVAKGESQSLFAERNRFARLAAYVVHASLLLIFAGGIADALWGYRGFMALGRGESSNQIELRDGSYKTLAFSVRCKAAGQENYEDGAPKRWWSQLTVLEDGREVKHEEIEVNKPLVHQGLRFFQSSYGSTGEVDLIRVAAAPKSDASRVAEIALRLNEKVDLDADTSVHVSSFVPDFVIVGGQVQTRSAEPNNPAIQLCVESKKAGESKLWLFPRYPSFSHPSKAPYDFQFRDMELGYFTGLQVSYEPGQWAVWTGVVLMGLGLAMAFYFTHLRVWAVPIHDGRGRSVLWIGAAVNKDHEGCKEQFEKLVQKIESELELPVAPTVPLERRALS